MESVKKNMVSILCGVVALLAILAVFLTPLPGLFEGLQEKLNASRATYQTIKGLNTRTFNKPVVDPQKTEPTPLDVFPNKRVIEAGIVAVQQMHEQSLTMTKQALDMNKRVPLVPGVLPRPMDGASRDNFKQAYHLKMQSFRKELNATSPPVPEEIQEQIDLELQNYKGGGRVQMNNNVPTNELDVEAQFRQEEEPKIPNRIKLDRAHKYTMYMVEPMQRGPNTMALGLDYSDRIPPREVRDLPEVVDIWAAQLSIWIQEDVVAAIKRTNEMGPITPTTNPAERSIVTVEHAPIKRLVRIDIPKEYIRKDGAVPIGADTFSAGPRAASGLDWGAPGRRGFASPAAPVPGAEAPVESPSAALTRVYTSSCTGRVCNSLFDVMHFTVVVDVDARFYSAFMTNLSQGRFITILEAHMIGVDRDQALHYGYIYGDQPVIQLKLKCEAVFFRDWTVGEQDPEKPKRIDGPMPYKVRELLGITAPGSAPAVSTGY